MSPNPSLDRRWIQTAGLPLPPAEQAIRDQLDRMARVEITPSTNRAVIFDAESKPIGVFDMMPATLALVQAAIDRDPGLTPEADPSKGDTLIREIKPGEALPEGGYRVIDDGGDPPPLELPGFDGPRVTSWKAEHQGIPIADDEDPHRDGKIGLLIVGLLLLLIVAVLAAGAVTVCTN